jgi:hypothetical protein
MSRAFVPDVATTPPRPAMRRMRPLLRPCHVPGRPTTSDGASSDRAGAATSPPAPRQPTRTADTNWRADRRHHTDPTQSP